MSENFRQQLEKLPDYLGEHLTITLVALGVGLLISLPLAVLLTRWPRARWPALTAAGVIQTIPSLALLALMVPLLGGAFGFWPAVIALILYSMLPILRNTVTGILDVDPALTEAARGIGMTPTQVLTRVELPLAAPVIIAGIRTATVWIVGIATLSTPVGQTSLGNYIFSGLQTRNWTAVLFGCFGAALLAMVLDMLIAVLERAVRVRSRARIVAAMTGLAVLVVGGLASPALARWQRSGSATVATVEAGDDPADLGVVRLGCKTFTEQYILMDLIGGLLENAGFAVEKTESLGSTIAFDALTTGRIDAYVDYSGTIWANYMKRSGTAPAGEVLTVSSAWMSREHDIVCLGPLGFENAYALAMRRARAEELGISTIDDLVRHAGQVAIGSDYEFFDRPEWYQLRDAYGLRFAEQVAFDSTLMYSAVAEGRVGVITAFSSDGRIKAFDLTVLDDTRDAFPPYDAVLLVRRRVAEHSAAVAALRPLIGGIDVEAMRQANLMVDREEDKRTVAEAARWLTTQLGATGG